MQFVRHVLFYAAIALVPVMLALGPVGAQQVPASRGDIAMSFSPVVKTTAPSVVNVYAKRIVQTQGRRQPFGADPFFRRFFGDELFGGRPRRRAQNSLGSGVIVDASGIVVTNNHVIKNGTEIRVVLSDKREFDAELILKDERTDLAVLRIKPDGEPLVPLSLGDQMRSRWVTWCLPSVIRSASDRRLQAASSPHWPGPGLACRPISSSFRPMRPSIPAIPEARWWT